MHIFSILVFVLQFQRPSLKKHSNCCPVCTYAYILLDFSLSVKAATLIFISGCGSAILSAKEGKSGSIYNLEKS